MATEGKREQQARTTKHTIMTCAIDLLASRPYEQISVKDICDAAGVSVGAFYHHFRSKENLLDEGYRVFDQQLEQDWETRDTARALDDVHFLINSQISSMQRMGANASAQYFKNQLSVDRGYMLDPHRFLATKLQEALARCIADGELFGDAADIADELLCVTRGTIYDWILHGCAYDLMDRAGRLVDIVLEHYAAGRGGAMSQSCSGAPRNSSSKGMAPTSARSASEAASR